MTSSLKDLAIQQALSNNWQNACTLNEQLLLENPLDVETLNRLAFALIKLGKYKKAKDMYKKVIELDKTNPIAIKNLKKLDTISKQNIPIGDVNGSSQQVNLQDLYIEEAGKTKTVDLKNIADKKILSLLQSGDFVKLVIKRSKIFVQTINEKYIGMLPEDMGTRLIVFMKGGNEYLAYIKAIDEKCVKVFIKETKRATRFKNQPSFTSTFAHSLSEE